MIAKSLATLGLATTLCLQSVVAAAQPPQQVLPEGIRGGSEVVPEAKVEIIMGGMPDVFRFFPKHVKAARR